MKTLKIVLGLTIGTILCNGQSYAQNTAPIIDAQPVSQTVAAGANVTFTVNATGSEAFWYQWFFNTTEIDGATTASLDLAAVQATNSGDYSVVISNELGVVTSDVAHLTVTDPTPPPPTVQTFLDFNNDGKPDLLWVHPNGLIAAWLMDGTNFLSSFLLPYRAPHGWNLAGEADFNHDGKLDFLWQHMNGTISVWYMDGTNRLGSFTYPRFPHGGWRVVGLSDFNKDSNADILWQSGNGQLAVWFMNGTTFQRSLLLDKGQRMQGGWKVVAVADVNGDGNADLLWQHGGGKILVWYMNGTTKTGTEFLPLSAHTSSSWHIAGNTDLNRDKKCDLLWQNSSGQVAYWLMNSRTKAKIGLLRRGKAAASGWTLECHK